MVIIRDKNNNIPKIKKKTSVVRDSFLLVSNFHTSMNKGRQICQVLIRVNFQMRRMNTFLPEFIIDFYSSLHITIYEIFDLHFQVGDHLIVAGVEVELGHFRELRSLECVFASSVEESCLREPEEGMCDRFPQVFGDEWEDGMQTFGHVLRKDGSRT